jgi:hypothetical protein
MLKAAAVTTKWEAHMSISDDDYVYDEDSGEWMPASELAE